MTIKSIDSNNVKCYYHLKELFSIWKCIHMYSCDANLNFVQSSVSHDPSEIILICSFAAQETFLIIISVENSCAASYFLETVIYFMFRILWWIEILKKTVLFEIDIVCDIINVYSPLINLMCHCWIKIKDKILLTANFWTVVNWWSRWR